MTATCSITDCDNKAVLRSWCQTHYQRWRKYGDPLRSLALVRRTSPRGSSWETRFWDKVYPCPVTGCWLWGGATNESRGGYGLFKMPAKLEYVHRISYREAYGEIPDGMCIDHQCRMTCCVNPEHLEAITLAENTRRGSTRRAARMKAAA